MFDPMTIIATATIASTAVGVYSAFNAPKPPTLTPPPPPANYYSYDENGNPSGEQVWDASKNAYIYKPAPLTDAQKAEKAQRDDIRSKMLSNLDKTPEDRLKAYDQYAQAFSDTMHRDTDKRYQDVVRSTDETMAARGMMGSRAYADTMGRLALDKTAEDTDIANKAALAKNDLANQDRNYYLNVLNSLDSGARADTLANMEKANSASNATSAANASNNANYSLMTSSRLAQWNAEMQRNTQITDTAMNTATGLAYLYGFKNPGNSGGPLGGGQNIARNKAFADSYFANW